MSDSKLTTLSALGTLAGTDLLYIVSSATSYKLPLSMLDDRYVLVGAGSITFPAREGSRGPNIISAFDNGPFNGHNDPTIFFGYNHDAMGAVVEAGEPMAMWAIEGYYDDGAVVWMEMYMQYAGLPGQGASVYRPFFSRANRATGSYDTFFQGNTTYFHTMGGAVKVFEMQAAQNISYKQLLIETGQNLGLHVVDNAGTPTKSVYVLSNWGATGQPVVGTFTSNPLSLATNGAEAINIGTGQLVGIGGTAGVKLQVFLDDATTNTAPNVTALTHNTSGTAAAGFGLMQLYQLESSTTANQSAAQLKVLWYEATHATRKADMVLTVFDTAEREGLRIRGAGSAPAIGFLGATPVARATHIADATNAADVITRANAILVVLENLGLVATS